MDDLVLPEPDSTKLITLKDLRWGFMTKVVVVVCALFGNVWFGYYSVWYVQLFLVV